MPSASPIAEPRQAALSTASAPLRVGLIGAGQVARKHLPAYQNFPDRLHLAAICDIRQDTAAQLASHLPAAAVYTDPDRMIREAAIDAVDICTTHPEHAPLALAAAQAGKHILVEKPMAITMPDCQAMVAAAERAGVILMVAQNQRYKPTYRAVQRVIREGELGDIHAIRMDAMLNVLDAAGPEHWVYDGHRAGGGVLISMASQRIDLSRFLLGDIRRVTAICRTTHPRFTHGAEDQACAILEFATGAIGELFATFTPYKTPWGESFMILGQRGTIYSTPPSAKSNDPALICSASRCPGEPSSRRFVPLEPDLASLSTDEMFTNTLLHFADCCRTGTQPQSSGRDNLGTMAAIFAMYRSASLGRAVDLAEIQSEQNSHRWGTDLHR